MLVAIKDLLSVIIIKAVGSRFTNVYVYEVEGNTVKDTARLVYPETFMWSDLWRLNISVLL
ncbi:Transmembrane protein [Phytophthora palmivora]|uniref:Transmembrane protein n=1 Tax=Phytophthora palmivora TaxID=4796 RepID=A0A2P4WX38_9STRA|nr:Transmembrane protein [Phytophthora palmivora]